MINSSIGEEKPQKSENSGIRRALSLLFLPAAFVYLEWTLQRNCAMGEGYHMGTALLAGFAFGLLCDIPAFAFRRKGVGFIAALILAEIGCLYFVVQFFVNNSYQTFMDPVTIFQGAGGVMDEFGQDLSRLIREGAGIIALYHVPVIALIVLYPVWQFTRKDRWTVLYLALAGLFLQSLAAGSTQMDSFSAPKYTYEYVFNDGIRNFGLITSTQRDVVYGITGKPEKPKKAADLVTRATVRGMRPLSTV